MEKSPRMHESPPAAETPNEVHRLQSELAAALQVNEALKARVAELEATLRHTDERAHMIAALIPRLEKAVNNIEKEIQTDPLTGAGNRRALKLALEKLHDEQRSAEHAGTHAVVLFDLDHFKSTNDTYGHKAGDAVLQQVIARAQTVITETARTTDTLVRWGGEEFAILCPNTTAEGAALLAERIKDALHTLAIETTDNAGAPITISKTASFGVAEFTGTEPDALDRAVKQADAALYDAKGAGRDQVAVFKEKTAA